MARIALRNYGWLEAGRHEPNTEIIREAYLEKQAFRMQIEELNGRNLGVEDLKIALRQINAPRPFRDKVWIRGEDVMVDTRGPPGEAFLGTIVRD